MNIIANRFVKHESPARPIDAATVNFIVNPFALAIWVYLHSQPFGSAPSEKQIREHFGIGRDRYLKSMAFLQMAGLVSTTRLRDSQGRLAGSQRTVYSTLGEGAA